MKIHVTPSVGLFSQGLERAFLRKMTLLYELLNQANSVFSWRAIEIILPEGNYTSILENQDQIVCGMTQNNENKNEQFLAVDLFTYRAQKLKDSRRMAAQIHENNFSELNSSLNWSGSKVMFMNECFDLKGSIILHVSIHPAEPLMAILLLNERTVKIYQFHKDPFRLVLLKSNQDSIHKYSWKHTVFGGPNETDCLFMIPNSNASHLIHIWAYNESPIINAMRENLEPCAAILWHENQKVLCTLTSRGSLLIWRPKIEQHWSWLVPGVIEMDENNICHNDHSVAMHLCSKDDNSANDIRKESLPLFLVT